MVSTTGPSAYVPVEPTVTFWTQEDVPASRPPDPKTGEYVSEVEAYLPQVYDSHSHWGWYEKCLSLPCSKCGLTITHFHSV